MIISRTAIIRSYFWPYSATELAWGFTEISGRKFTAAEIEQVWSEEAQHNPMLCDERPKCGFPPDEKTKLKERLAA